MKCKDCACYKNEWCSMVTDSPDPDMERDCGHFILAQRWIPVEERLPEANKSVLVSYAPFSYVPFTADETERAGLYVSIAFLGNQSPCGRWYWGEYEGEELTDFVEVINEITHWMLLPEPPEVRK